MDEKRRAEMDRIGRLGEVFDSKMDESAVSERMEGLVGICATCTSFVYQKTRLDSEKFRCSRYSDPHGLIPINTCDPLKECSNYHKRGEMDIWDMKEMAILIDGAPKKVPGFNRDEWQKKE